KFTNPGPATSTAATWGGGSALRISASCDASSRGLRPAALAATRAKLLDQSPYSRRAGRSTVNVGGSGCTSSLTSAARRASVRVSRITGASASRLGEDVVDPVDELERVER